MNDVQRAAAGLQLAGQDLRATPVMAQYLDIKAMHADALLFYRMGDFYELFFADAEIAANALGIALTKRGKHMGEDIPMCGVPVHAADSYLQRLIRLGHRVAICEQLEDPAEARKRGSKSVVRRDVVRLVTPGTLTEDSLLDAKRNNFLGALAWIKGTGELALAWTDVSSGFLFVQATATERVATDLARLECSELLLPDSALDEAWLKRTIEPGLLALTPLPSSKFDSAAAERRLRELFGVASLDGFGAFAKSEVAALGALIDYIGLTQAGNMPFLRAPVKIEGNASLIIDAATRANLEISRTLGGERQGSLLATIDKTMTSAGSRRLAQRLAGPLTDPSEIDRRLDEVDHFLAFQALRSQVRSLLSAMPDLERSLGRLAIGRGGPRDLAAIGRGIELGSSAARLIADSPTLAGIPKNLEDACSTINQIDQCLALELSKALLDDLPISAGDGGFVRPGYCKELDENRHLVDDTRQIIAGLQQKYAADAGIKSLKIRHNNVLGYFIEVGTQHAAALQASGPVANFKHRQTVANAVRFVTEELATLDQRVSSAAERATALELGIFDALTRRILQNSGKLSEVSDAMARVDVSSALAELSEAQRYVRPVVDNSVSFSIEAGRHPVVEKMLQASAESAFVPNNCRLPGEGDRLWIVTGPNMAGKSTFLRQNALIVILAQMGSHVPAARAHIGVVDRLFSRVGAADDIARGRSTFMVEMVETAAILNQAGNRSLVILDEIGRGTATYDGLSIAWATIEHLHDVNRCRGLFATHYHELTALTGRLDHVSNHTVKVKEWHSDIVFLHEVAPGIADRSYGIHVARLAGLPKVVTVRASEILKKLESANSLSKRQEAISELPLFSKAETCPENSFDPNSDALAEKLANIHPDELSPREALALLYEFKSLAASKP